MRSASTRQKIALFGHFGAGNLGNEATLRAMVRNLRTHLPDAEISCVCSGPEKTASEYDIAAAPIRASLPLWKRSRVSGSHRAATNARRPPRVAAGLRASLRIALYPLRQTYRWLETIAFLRDKDALVMTGTGMLGDSGLHYDLFRWAAIAKLSRCKLLFVSVGAGRIPQPLRRWCVKAALKLADYRSYRDHSSRDYLASIGLDVRNDPVFPDLAFSLPGALGPADDGPGRHGTVIGVGLVDYYGMGHSETEAAAYRDYLRRLACFVGAMLERNYAVRILIGDFVWDQQARQDLRSALEDHGVPHEDGRILDTPAFSVDELLSQLASVDIVVSSRFHNLVLALTRRKPVFAISYHAEKFRPLMAGVGLAEFYCDIDHIDVAELIGKVATLRANAPAITVETARQTENYRLALDKQYERMREILAGAH